jgi:arylsulfatase A-like enzyme
VNYFRPLEKKNRAALSVGAVVVLLGGGLLLYSWGDSPAPRTNLVLITVDTLRADHVSAYGYERATTPHIDHFAAEGVRFADALVPRSETWPALTSILTGTHPRTHGVRANGAPLDASHETLIERLRESGYTTAAFLTNMTTASHRGLDHLQVWPEDPSNRIPDYVADARATQAAREWMRSHAGERFVLWLHLLGPHEPYEPDPSLPRQHATDYVGDLTGARSTLVRAHRSKRQLEPAEVAHVISLYDEDVSAIDTHMSALLSEIDAAGNRDETLVVFTGDHGEELYDHDLYFLHSYSLSRSVLRTPLIMRLPGVLPEGRVVTELVQAVDIAPTLLSLLGLPTPESIEGVDLSALAKGEVPHAREFPVAYAELGPEIYALQTPRWKYIHNPKRYSSSGASDKGSGYFRFFEIAVDELYDLQVDPGEHHNVASQRPEVVGGLRRHLLSWLEDSEPSPASAAMSPESRAELKAPWATSSNQREPTIRLRRTARPVMRSGAVS